MSATDAIYENLIIGGGISGLGMAHQCLRRGLHTLVLEREERVGGCLRSHAFPEAGGFWTELGAHTCYNSYGHLLEMLDQMGLSESLRPKLKQRFRMLAAGGLQSVLSRLHPLELALSLPRLLLEKKSGRTVADYYARVLGERNYRDLFGPAFDAVICQPAGEFPADLLFRRKPRRKDRPRSFTLPGGLEDIPAAVVDQDGLETHTGQGVQGLAREPDWYAVTTEDGRVFRGRHLTLAVPPDAAARLLADLHPRLAEPLGRIRMAAIDSVSVALPADALSIPPLAGIIAPNDDFYAAVSRDYLPDSRYRGFTFHFRPDRLDAAGQVRRISQVLGVDPTRLTALARRRNRLPALRAGHADLVAQIDQALTGMPLALTGNYFLGVSIEDCLTRSTAEAQRLFGV